MRVVSCSRPWWCNIAIKFAIAIYWNIISNPVTAGMLMLISKHSNFASEGEPCKYWSFTHVQICIKVTLSDTGPIVIRYICQVTGVMEDTKLWESHRERRTELCDTPWEYLPLVFLKRWQLTQSINFKGSAVSWYRGGNGHNMLSDLETRGYPVKWQIQYWCSLMLP